MTNQKKKISIVIISIVCFVAIILLFINYKFNYTGTDIMVSNFGDKSIEKGNTAGFIFNLNNGDVDGIKMYFFREFIILDEDNRYLEITTTYERKNEEVKYTVDKIMLKNIKRRRYNYIDIEDTKIVGPTKIIVSMRLDRPLGEGTYFKIGYDDGDPDPAVDRSPKIIYQTSLAGFFAETKESFNIDKKFFKSYLFLVSFDLFLILIASIFGDKIVNDASQSNKKI